MLAWTMMHPNPHVLQRGPRGHETLIANFGSLIDSCVDFGTHLAAALLEGEKVPPHRVTTSLMLREFLAHLDGSSALVRIGCSQPTKVILRSAFEAYLNLLYLLIEDAERRSLCYALAEKHQSIRFLKRRDPSTSEGRETADAVARDTSAFKVSRLPAADLPTVAQIEAELRDEPFAEMESEWIRTRRAANGRFPKWYQLFGGPKDLWQLADRVGRAALYDLLYREWSASAHVESVLRNVEILGATEAAIPSLRDPSELQLLTSVAVSLALACFKDVIDRTMASRLPQYLAWYAQEIKPGYTAVTSDEELIRVEKRGEG
jgi:hypothetical protein